MSRLTPNEKREKARDELGDEVVKTFALLETLSLVPRLLRDNSIPGLKMITLDGLELLALERGRKLHECFHELDSLDQILLRQAAAGGSKPKGAVTRA